MPAEEKVATDLHENQGLGMEMPLAQGELVYNEATNAVEATVDDKSVLTSGAEADRMLAGLNLPPEVAAAIAAATAGIPAVADEISDEEARAFVQARRGAMPFPAAGGHVDEVVRPPNTLPAVLTNSVFDKNSRRFKSAETSQPRWLTIYDLPGYMRDGVRVLGRTIFRSFPCFKKHERAATEAGHEPLGSIRVLAAIQGGGPSTDAELNVMARWVRQNGVVIDHAELEFPLAIEGYRPRVILSATDNQSFLMVEDSRERGAPCDALYIYSWVGGREFYLGAGDGLQQLARMAIREIAARRPDARPEPEALPSIALMATPVIQDATPEERRARVKALPQAPAQANPLPIEIRRSGFRIKDMANPKLLEKDLEDGRLAVVDFSADVAILRIMQDGVEELAASISSASEIEELLAPSPGLRP